MSYELAVKKNISDFRSRYGLSALEPVNLYALLLKLKILTMFKPLSDSISGIVGQIEEDTKFILINSKHTIGRQNFMIAHELYHLYFDETFKDTLCEENLKGIEEKKADKFASMLLMPEEGILNLIPDNQMKKNTIHTSTLLTIEYSYNCSRSALLRRLRDFNLIDKDFGETKKINIEKEAEELGFSTDIYRPGNENLVIGDYAIMAKDLFDAEKISESSYLQFMNDIGLGGQISCGE